MRLFFDICKQQGSSYDFHGCYFSKSEDAAVMGELIAADLGCSENNDWVNSQVQVRTAAGEMLFSIPVLAAA